MDRRRPAAVLLAIMFVGVSLQVVALPAKAKDRTFVIEMRSVRFNPDLLAVDPGDSVTLIVFNNDSMGHTFDLPAFNVHLGTVTNTMPPGSNGTANFTAATQGTFWFLCSVTGHATPRGDGSYVGMAGRLVVGQTPPPPDLTIAFVVIGVIAAVAASVGLLLWWRRRASGPNGHDQADDENGP